MITLLIFPASLNSYCPSPFGVKARHLLHMSGQDWQREDTPDPRKMPYGKLPAIRTAKGDLIADSENIRLHLESQGADFDPGLDAPAKAQAQAWIRLAEEHMYFHALLDRWADDTVWPILRKVYFDAIPAPVRGIVTGLLRRNVLKGMNTQGLGRMTPKERLARIDHDFTALATLLSEKPFLLADHPTSADLSVAPMLESMMKTPVETDLQARVAGDAVLAGYVARVNTALEMDNEVF